MIQMDSHYLNNTQHVYDKGRVMQTEQQRAVTRLCIQCGLFLLQHGAESALVDELSSRLGRALGMDSVESSISSNAIVLTTIKDGQCLTSTRKNHDRGINMHVVTEVQHIVILAEHHLLDYKGVEKRFSQIQPLRYPRWLVALMVGLSCACFCKLNKGGWDGAVITFLASTAAMYIRQLLAQRHLHPQINFCLTAFAATTISGLLLQLPTFSNTPTIAMAASVLLLVPGFPLINAVADMFKGHINTGLARWAIASLLTLATCVGVVMALTIWGLRGWSGGGDVGQDGVRGADPAAQAQVGGKEDSQDGGRDPDGWAGRSAAFFLYTCSVHENSPSCPTQPKNPRTGQIISDYIIASYVSECNYRTVTVDRPNFPGFPQF